MSSDNEAGLVMQRDALRIQLQAQRQLIARQMSINKYVRHDAGDGDTYPRSMTMRFLSQRPAAKLLAEFATVFVGARFLKSVTSALAVSRMVQSAVGRH